MGMDMDMNEREMKRESKWKEGKGKDGWMDGWIPLHLNSFDMI